MNNQKRTYYYDLSQAELGEVSRLQAKPRILAHDCCAVCATVPLEQLAPYFRITLYFNNSNIFPEAEYQRRLAELRRYLAARHPEVGLIVAPYDHEGYMRELRPYQNDREGGRRCRLCYRRRMAEAYDYADAGGYEWFTTVMTISRQKDSRILNEIGSELAKSHPSVRYFYSDFKKKGGQDRSIELRNANSLYQQDYCGCEYSLRNQE